MSWISLAAIYFIMWWLVLFLVLPVGIRTQGEAGEITPGPPESAPVKLNLKRKLLITTLASMLLLLVILLVLTLASPIF